MSRGIFLKESIKLGLTKREAIAAFHNMERLAEKSKRLINNFLQNLINMWRINLEDLQQFKARCKYDRRMHNRRSMIC